MAQQGLCSRREADKFIERGLVRVNGEVVDQLGSKVSPDADIELMPEAQSYQESQLTFLLHKPIGYVSGQPEKGYKAAVELIQNDSQFGEGLEKLKKSYFTGLAPAGRLDIDSKGLLILTQDGRIAKALIGENSPIEKEYLVRLPKMLSEEKIEQLRFGLELDGKKLKKAKVEKLNKDQLKITLTEGKKRQIRRMLELVGSKVIGLKRVRIGPIKLGKLPESQWRLISQQEQTQLLQSLMDGR